MGARGPANAPGARATHVAPAGAVGAGAAIGWLCSHSPPPGPSHPRIARSGKGDHSA